MRESLLELLVDPVSRTPLTLEPLATAAGDVISGTLRGSNGSQYPITNGIPRLLVLDDEQQKQIELSPRNRKALAEIVFSDWGSSAF